MNSRSNERRRIVVTGLGVVAANGQTIDAFWSSILKGQSAGGRMTRFDPGNAPTLVAAEIRDFDATRYMDAKTARRLDTSHRYGLAAAYMAAQDARINCAEIDADRVGVVEGTSASANEMAVKADEGYAARGYRGVGPFALINGYAGAGSGEIAELLGVKGHAISISSSSASGNDAIGYALTMIQDDDADVMVAGGSEAPIMPGIWGALCVNKIMTRKNNDPKHAMRPYDRNRDGILLGEGAAYLIMEELSHARARGARIYCELLGHGRSCEAYHPVAPHPEGIGLKRAMQKGLRDAQVDASQIDYINAHGTATDANDLVETKAIKAIFGSHARQVAVSSTKPVTGHLMGAAGALETIVCALALYHQVIPLTANLKEPADECDLDYVPGESRPYPIRMAMNLNSGFGGKNSCLILKKFEN